jgi:DNA-binding IclR family transcriptional regulator
VLQKEIVLDDVGRPSSAVAKAFAVIRVLRRSSSPMTLTAIAEQVGIAPSTAHSVLMELLAQGAVLQDGDKRYQLGPSLFYLGAAFARQTPVFRSIWIELVAVANELSMLGAVAVPWEDHHLIIAVHQAGPPGLEVAFGGRMPLSGGAWGKAYWAWSGRPGPIHLDRFTERSITDLAEYRAEVDRTRGRGFATDEEEFADGVCGVTTAVTSHAGYEGLVSLMAPAARMLELGFERTGRRLAALAGRASLALGDSSRVAFVGGD